MRHPLSYGKVMRPVSAAVRNRQWQTRFLPGADYLNLGCGGNVQPGFVNVDWWRKPGIDLCWDMTRPLPFADGSMRGVYSEHAVEHVTLEQARGVFAEVLRLLQPGGVFRLVVPDAEQWIDGYVSARAGGPFRSGDLSADRTPMMEVNRIFRGEGHQYAWDFVTARYALERAGFAKVERCSFNDGADPVLLIDSERRRPESLYVEAVKGD